MGKNKKQRNRESRTKKARPRIYLNMHKSLAFLSFSSHSKPLSKKEFDKAREEMPLRKKICVSITFTSLKNILFNPEQNVTIHYKVAKYLYGDDDFRNSLKREIKMSINKILNYKAKWKEEESEAGKGIWKDYAREERYKLTALINLRETILDLIVNNTKKRW